MSKKTDYPELRAQLQALNNKELHHKCVEYGMNVPVAESTRDVIIRKLIKSITGDSTVTSPKANKKQSSTPNERRKTVNVTVHVSSDEEEAERQMRSQHTKTRTRTQSPKGHNVTFDTIVNNNRRSNASSTIKQQSTAQRVDANANAGVGLSSSARIVPIEVDLKNNIERNDYNIEVRRNDSSSTLNKDVNLNRGVNYSGGMYNSTPLQMDKPSSGYKTASANLGFSNYQQDARDTPISGHKAASPNLGFSQIRNTAYQQDDHSTSRYGFISPPQESTLNRPLGYYSPGSSPIDFNNQNKASHSSTHGSQFGSGTSPNTQEPVFKRPIALSKTNITNTSYNQADAQRLYPRLPTDLATPPSYTSSPPSSPDSLRSNRAPSLTKSGVMTTSYYQEISPVKEVKHFEVESGDEPAVVDGAGDYERHNNASIGGTNYERSSYLAGIKRGTEAQLPFKPHLQSTLHDTLDATSRYSSSPLSRETYVPSAAAPKPSSPSLIKRYSTTSRGNASYTSSIDEPDSGSDTEKLSGDEIYVQDSEDEEYMPGNKKIYSSFGSNKIQERLPYRRSNTARLSASPSARYSHSPTGRSLLNPVGDDDDDDDVHASLRNFLTTLDRKYHIKQMLYMFAIFAAAVFIYVMFIEKTPTDDDVLVASKVRS